MPNLVYVEFMKQIYHEPRIAVCSGLLRFQFWSYLQWGWRQVSHPSSLMGVRFVCAWGQRGKTYFEWDARKRGNWILCKWGSKFLVFIILLVCNLRITWLPVKTRRQKWLEAVIPWCPICSQITRRQWVVIFPWVLVLISKWTTLVILTKANCW